MRSQITTSYVSILGVFVALGLSGSNANGQAITTELVASGLSKPLDLASPAGDGRLFIAEQTGRIRIVDGGVLLPAPFFDASGLVASSSYTGLRGLVFHPDYASNGYVYIAYDTVTSGAGDTVLDRLTVSSGDPNVLDPASRVEILRNTQTAAWHGGGDMAFGPDGYLYAAFGDGHGQGNDPFCNAQDGNTLLGKMIRIDVDGGPPYSIPTDNPFVGVAGVRDEIWHLGLRHPWRWSFDAATGDLYIADVGQSAKEEIDFAAAGVKGLNFGWKVMEGTNCFSTSSCTSVAPCNDPGYTNPILSQTTSLNCSITGGFVYRGAAIPSEQGNYFFGSYCSGAVWSFAYDGTSVTGMAQRNADLGMSFGSLTSFGEDAFGELYLLRQGGTVHKIVPACPPAVNYCSSNANSAGTAAVISMTGTSEISSNNMGLLCSGAAPQKPGLFFYGPNQTQVPFGEGTRCIGGQIFRLPPPLFVDPFGLASRAIDFGVQPTGGGGAGAIFAGSQWNFQFWYRDPPGGPAGFNLSDGLGVTFCP